MGEVRHTVQGGVRKRILSLAASQPIVHTAFVRVPGLRELGLRFVAGATLDSALVTIAELNSRGLSVSLNHVGTHTTTEAAANAATDAILASVAPLARTALPTHLAVKLTHIGLDVRDELGRANLRRVLDAAAAAGVFVVVDMEESRYVDRTIAIFEEVRSQYGTHRVGIAIQSYLRAHRADTGRLAQAGSRIRLVKGGYWETADLVYRSRAEIDGAFLEDIGTLIRDGVSPAIATHDEVMIRGARGLAADAGRDAAEVEYQLLYGVRSELAAGLVRDGCPVRVYVPYGDEWFTYVLGCVRRMPGAWSQGLARRVRSAGRRRSRR